MTEHGSSPGRPRGRRARQDGGGPDQQGYDGRPRDEREFPDLPPIRPREARARDARGPGDWGQQPQPGQPPLGQPSLGQPQPGQAQSGPGQAQSGPGQGQSGLGQPGAAAAGGAGRYAGGGYPGGAPGGPGYPVAGAAQPDGGYGQYGNAAQYGTTAHYGDGQYGDGQYGGGRHSGGQPSAGGYGAGQNSGAPNSGAPNSGAPNGGGQHGAGQHGSGQYGGGYPEGGYPAPGYGAAGQQGQGQGQAPWADQAWPGQQPPAGPDDQTWAGQPAYPSAAPYSSATSYQAPENPAGPGQSVATVPPGSPPRQAEREEDVPSWAEPDSVEAFSARWHRRGLDTRDDRRGTRRNRRRLLIAGGATLALVIGAVAYLLSGGPGAANLGFGNFVTTFLPGELQQVPDACTVVPQSLLSENLPGKLKQAAPPLNSGPSTSCTWTLDSAPTYKVLEVSLMAYSPSGLASGSGSATFAAEDAYQTDEANFQKPGPHSGQPAATVADLSGMPGGTDTSSFATTQVFNRGGAITDKVNVVVRYRNVIITVTVDGLDQSGPGSTKKYGPVQMSDLTATGKSVAQRVASQIVK